jgi:iron complex transport system substrate-binding protein
MVRPARLFVTALAALALMASACGKEPPDRGIAEIPHPRQVFPATLMDDEGAQTTLDAPPERIVTFAPSDTEIVFALGLGDRLVGVSGAYDDYPREAASIEAVAGRSGVEPNLEKVVALEPDVLLTAFIGGEWKERLRELGVPVFTTVAASFDDTLADFGTLGRLLGAQAEANALVQEVGLDAAAIEDELQGSERVTCFLDLGDLFTVGPGSLEFDLLQRAGCDPITGESDDAYPQWSLEQLIQDDPDVYLVAEGVPLDQVAKQQGIRNLTAVREGRIHEVNSDLISRPGPRVAQGIENLAAALHDEAAAA